MTSKSLAVRLSKGWRKKVRPREFVWSCCKVKSRLKSQSLTLNPECQAAKCQYVLLYSHLVVLYWNIMPHPFMLVLDHEDFYM